MMISTLRLQRSPDFETSLSAPHPVTKPVGGSVEILIVFRDAVVPPRRPHPSTSLVLESGIQECHRAPAIAAAPTLPLPHQFYAASVFLVPESRLRVADFSSLRVHPHRSVHDGFVAQGFRWVVAGARDGTAADHIIISSECFRSSTALSESCNCVKSESARGFSSIGTVASSRKITSSTSARNLVTFCSISAIRVSSRKNRRTKSCKCFGSLGSKLTKSHHCRQVQAISASI